MNIDIKICEDDEIQLKYIEEKVKIILNDTNYNIDNQRDDLYLF